MSLLFRQYPIKVHSHLSLKILQCTWDMERLSERWLVKWLLPFAAAYIHPIPMTSSVGHIRTSAFASLSVVLQMFPKKRAAFNHGAPACSGLVAPGLGNITDIRHYIPFSDCPSVFKLWETNDVVHEPFQLPWEVRLLYIAVRNAYILNPEAEREVMLYGLFLSAGCRSVGYWSHKQLFCLLQCCL